MAEKPADWFGFTAGIVRNCQTKVTAERSAAAQKTERQPKASLMADAPGSATRVATETPE